MNQGLSSPIPKRSDDESYFVMSKGLKSPITRKCGDGSDFVDNLDVQKELRSLASRAISRKEHRAKSSLLLRPLASDEFSQRDGFGWRSLQHNMMSSPVETVSFPQARKLGPPGKFPGSMQSISEELDRLRCCSKTKRIFRSTVPNGGSESPLSLSFLFRDSQGSPELKDSLGAHQDSAVCAFGPSHRPAANFDLKNHPDYDELIKILRKSFSSWSGEHRSNMEAKKKFLEQYVGCCIYLKRSPFLKSHLRQFLTCASTSRIDLSGCGVSSKDVTSFICAVAGHGCGLKPDQSYNLQRIRAELGECCLSSINMSKNNLGADGMSAFSKSLIKADFCGLPCSLDSPLQPTCGLTELNVTANSLGIGGAVALEHLIRSPNCTLKSLSVCSNMLADLGCSVLFKSLCANSSLVSFALSDNGASNSAGIAAGEMFEQNSTLQELNLAYNHLRGQGAKRLCAGLALNTSLLKLNLGWNGFGDDAVFVELTRSLPYCKVEELNLASNRIKMKGAAVLAECLQSKCCIKEVIIDGNQIGQIGARLLYRSIEQAKLARNDDFMIVLSAKNCGANLTDRNAFDPAEAAGSYKLDMTDPYNRTILMNLMKMSISKVGSFLALKVQDKETNMNATLDGIGARICDNGSIDVTNWTVLTSAGVNLPILDLLDAHGHPIPLAETWAKMLNKNDKSASFVLEFVFKNERKPPTENDRLSQSEFNVLHEVFSQLAISSEECIEKINVVFGSDTFIALEQFNTLFNLLNDQADPSRYLQLSEARVLFVSRCYHKLVEVEERSSLIFKLTNVTERSHAERALGSVSLEFSPFNPTGLYILNLTDWAEREVLLRLVELKNSLQPREAQLHEFYHLRNRVGGLRESVENCADLERVWRNCKLDGNRFDYFDGWKIPSEGILELDFVYIKLPASRDSETLHSVLSERMFVDLIAYCRSNDQSVNEKVLKIRKTSFNFLFTCAQLAELLTVFQQSDVRVEICVIGYSRTVDWYGYKWLVAKLLPRELKIFQHRVGKINLFNDVVAVDYYELDLERGCDRFIMQELLHLASWEPGDNMKDVSYQGADFIVPAGWLKEVPRTGNIALYYCREQTVIEKVFESGSWEDGGSPFHIREDWSPFGPTAWSKFFPKWLKPFLEQNPKAGPVPSIQPRDEGWVVPHKIRRIKHKMAEKYPNPKVIFDAIDRDGGGSLDRKELAVGLFNLGVWLGPSELEILLSTLDTDGGGDIDFAEFENFWETYSFD